MILLLDTHILLWAAIQPERLPSAAASLLHDESHSLVFSVVSLWEVAIKRTFAPDRLDVDPSVLRRGLLTSGYAELAVTGAHVTSVATLPPLHKDPFDRMLVAQAMREGMVLLTADRTVGRYPGPVRCV